LYSLFWAVIKPSISSVIILWALNNPKPFPGLWCWVVKYGSKTLSIISSSIPPALSVISIFTFPFSIKLLIVTIQFLFILFLVKASLEFFKISENILLHWAFFPNNSIPLGISEVIINLDSLDTIRYEIKANKSNF